MAEDDELILRRPKKKKPPVHRWHSGAFVASSIYLLATALFFNLPSWVGLSTSWMLNSRAPLVKLVPPLFRIFFGEIFETSAVYP